MTKNSAHILILSVAFLIALGLVMLFSVSAFAPDNRGNTTYFLTRQAIWLGMGLVACIVASRVDYHKWVSHGWIIIGLAAVLLLATFIPGVGLKIKGSNRWIGLGFFNLQPSELVKLSVIAFLAFWLGRNQKNIEKFKEGFAIPMAVIGVLCMIFVKQGDLGSAMMLILMTFLLMFSAGTKKRYILPLPVLGVLGILTLAMFIPQRRARMLAFLDPEAHKLDGGWQVWNALVAFGSGGISGVGLGKGVQKMFYVPEAHTDFIFSIIGEELGLVWTLLVVLAFLTMALSAGAISFHAPDTTGVLLGIGVTSMICIQAGLNIAVVTSLVPPKGIGLPFISYGGTNLLVCLICIGILLNIHRQAQYEPEPLTLNTKAVGA